VPFVAARPEAYAGRSVGNGHCVAYVRAAAQAPHTSAWIEGAPVWEHADTLPTGTAIATFDASGRYANNTDGTSHTAIFVEPAEGGIVVWDQWVGHAVATRTIRAKGGEGLPCDDADAYAVIETA
jgi:hypothetical protein